MSDIQFQNEKFAVIRTPVDQSAGTPFEVSSHALFPGISLAQSEPALVVLMYDSLLQQIPDTAMFLYEGYGADPLLNRKYQQRLLTRWRALGKPKVILTTPEDRKFFRGSLGEIPTRSLYEILLDKGVSGGCSRELYRLDSSEDPVFLAQVRELANSMGAVITEDDRAPLLTSSMQLRNDTKEQGRDAVHILELIYGMGVSNQHLAHMHSEDHDHSKAPEIRDTILSEEEKAAWEGLFDDATKKQNLLELHDTLLSFFWGE